MGRNGPQRMRSWDPDLDDELLDCTAGSIPDDDSDFVDHPLKLSEVM